MNLIYDRTAEDVEEAKRIIAKLQAGEPLTVDEQTAYLAGLRGCYNATDLNRVESAVVELSAALNEAGYANVTVPRTWADGEIVTADQWSQYLANVQTLISTYYTLPDSPELPSPGSRLDIQGANAIERILTDIDALIGWMQHSYRKSGTFRSGENTTHLPMQRSVT